MSHYNVYKFQRGSVEHVFVNERFAFRFFDLHGATLTFDISASHATINNLSTSCIFSVRCLMLTLWSGVKSMCSKPSLLWTTPGFHSSVTDTINGRSKLWKTPPGSWKGWLNYETSLRFEARHWPRIWPIMKGHCKPQRHVRASFIIALMKMWRTVPVSTSSSFPNKTIQAPSLVNWHSQNNTVLRCCVVSQSILHHLMMKTMIIALD